MADADPRRESAVPRLASIDVIRGTAMVLMAIDHVRVYAGVPADGVDPFVFFTRWVTHFCAPIFVFLAGTSAFLRRGSRAGLSRFLLTRGLWLVCLELTLIHFTWSFNPALMKDQMAGVIWMIGWSMILMAGLVRLPWLGVTIFGAGVVLGHNLIPPPGDSVSPLASIVYYGMARGPVDMGGDFSLMVLYSLVPWVGVMAMGYGFGRVVTRDPSRRDRLCLTLGLGATAAFVFLRALNLYGDPSPWTSDGRMPAALSFLNTTKYPASLLFLLMTLGPPLALLPLLERSTGALTRALAIFGRVPFFYYILHIPLIHLLAFGVSLVRTGEIVPWLFANHPMDPGPMPEGYRWSLGLLYLVWVIAVGILYVASRRFAAFKSKRRDWWLSYL
jgi:uncharacterized membrane protein